MATFFVISDALSAVEMDSGPYGSAFFRMDQFGCGEADEADEQGVQLTDQDLLG